MHSFLSQMIWEKKRKCSFLLILVDHKFFVPNSYSEPLLSLIFLERQQGGIEKEGTKWLVGIIEIICSNTFNGPKKETMTAEGKGTLEGQWGEQRRRVIIWKLELHDPGPGCVSTVSLGTLLPLPAPFLPCVMSTMTYS